MGLDTLSYIQCLEIFSPGLVPELVNCFCEMCDACLPIPWEADPTSLPDPIIRLPEVRKRRRASLQVEVLARDYLEVAQEVSTLFPLRQEVVCDEKTFRKSIPLVLNMAYREVPVGGS